MQWEKILKFERKHMIWMVVPFLFTTMLVSSLYSYQYMNLAFFTIVRNLGPMVCLPIECAILSEKERPNVTKPMVFSMLTMLLGAILYSYDSVSISLIGLAAAGINMTFGISDRLLQRRLMISECKDMPTEACAFMNNFVGMFPAVGCAMLVGEVTKSTSVAFAANWTDPKVLVLIALSCAIGVGISYFGLATQRAVSATSVMIIQNIVKVGVIAMGAVFFGDTLTSPIAGAGIILSFAGSIQYSKIQMDLKVAEKAAAEKKPLVEEGKKAVGV